MAEEQKRHYRTGGKITHAGCEILPNGKDIDYIVISHIKFFEKHNVGGREEANVWVAYFAENPYTKLPMVLNATNKKRLAKLAKTDYIEDIKNFAVRMTREEAKDIQMGGMTWGLRVSMIPAKAPATPPMGAPAPPKEKVELTIDHPKFTGAKASLDAGEVTMDKIEQHYIISEEVKAALLATDEQGTGVEEK